VLALAFLLTQYKSRSHPKLIFALPVLQLVWVNAHGGVSLLGIALAGAMLLDRAWDLKRTLRPWDLWRERKLGGHALAFAGVLAASLANPHGFRALLYGSVRMQSPMDNREFQSFWSLLQGPVDLSLLLFIAYAGLLAAFFVTRRRAVGPFEWLIFSSLLALTLVFFRFRPLLALLMAPSLSAHLTHVLRSKLLRSWIAAAAGLAIVVNVANVEAAAYFYRFGTQAHAGVLPVDAVRFIKEARLSGNVFNSYRFGGYLIWSLWPSQKVFIDGREDVYIAPGVLTEYLHAFDSRRNWNDLAAKYAIDYAVVQYPETAPATPEDSVESVAFPRAEWALVYFDDVAAIYVRRNGKNEAVIKQAEIRSIQPLQLSSYLDGILRDPDALRLFMKEMQENLRRRPASFRAHFTLGMLHAKRGPEFLGKAVSEFEQAVQHNPDFFPAYLNLGILYRRLGRISEARRAFERCLALQENLTARRQLSELARLPH
jgi:tetratricopeptide (TPR) repeat protein